MDCLLALPALHTLGIVNSDGTIEPQAFKSASRHKLEFPNITKVAIPAFASPILAFFPQVEEIFCFCKFSSRRSATRVLNKLRKPSFKERHGQVEPVLKCIAMLSAHQVFYSIRGVCVFNRRRCRLHLTCVFV